MSESGKLRLRVVTPTGPILDKDVYSVTACSELGEFCVLPEHRPILASLRMGRLLVSTADGETESFVTDQGFFEGGPKHVNIITQRCVSVSEIDAEAIQSEIDGLEAELAELDSEDPSKLLLEDRLRWAKARAENAAQNS